MIIPRKTGSPQASFFDVWDKALAEPAPSAGIASSVLGVPVHEQSLAEPEPPPVPVLAAQVQSPLPIEASGAAALNMSDLDAGAELIHNRRNRYKNGLSWAEIAGENAALKVKLVTKDKVWPRPDYEDMVARGCPRVVAYQVKLVYDSIAAKPAVSDPTDEHLQTYIEQVSAFREAVQVWSETPSDWFAMLQAYTVQRAGLAKLLDGMRPDKQPVPLRTRMFPEGHSKKYSVVDGASVYNATEPNYDALRKLVKEVEAGWPAKKESWQIQGFSILSRPLIEHGVYRFGKDTGKFEVAINGRVLETYATADEAREKAESIKPFVLFNKRNQMVDSFDSHEAAVVGARKAATSKRKDVISEKGVRVEAATRVGPERRVANRDVASEELVVEFGLKGVNFGNWMKTPAARKEAQLHLNHAYDALHDLAEILGIPPKAVGLGGMLGIAIGAQGNGSRSGAAHFIPGVNEINITRESGAGSLGHEWGHALDHAYGVVAGASRDSEPFMSHHASIASASSGKKSELRREMLVAYSRLMASMTVRLQTDEEVNAAAVAREGKYKRRLDSWIDEFRSMYDRSYTRGKKLSPEIEAIIDELYAPQKSPHVKSGNAWLSATVVKLRDIYKEAHGRLYPLDKSETITLVADSYVHATTDKPEPARVDTHYYSAAKTLDTSKSGKLYWSTRAEMFARAFDAYLSDRLAKMGRENGYLSHTGRDNETVPRGSERELINQCFDEVVAQIKVKDIGNVAGLYSFAAGVPATHLSTSDVASVVASIKAKWPGMPEVTVLANEADALFEVRPGADGVYHDGRIYVVASNIAGEDQLKRVLAHECIFHKGLHDLLGDARFDGVIAGVQALKLSGDKNVLSLAHEVACSHGVLPRRDEAAEIIARAGERALDADGEVSVRFGFMKGMYSRLAGWLRDRGFDVEFSNLELQGLLHRAAEHVKRPASQVAASDASQVILHEHAVEPQGVPRPRKLRP